MEDHKNTTKYITYLITGKVKLGKTYSLTHREVDFC